MTHARLIAILEDLIESQAIMVEEHTDAMFLPQARATLDDARALLAALKAGDIIVTELKAAT